MPAKVIILATYRPRQHTLATDLMRAWSEYQLAVWDAWIRSFRNF